MALKGVLSFKDTISRNILGSYKEYSQTKPCCEAVIGITRKGHLSGAKSRVM